MRVAIYTLGCKVNQYETQAMEAELTGRGHALVPFDGAADAYVINTCTVTAVSDKKSRQMIRQARKRSPHAVVAVCGCYAQTDPEAVEALGVDLVMGTADRMGFLDALEALSPDGGHPVVRVDDALRRRQYEHLPAGGLEGRTRAMLKVEDGCVNFCTYCIIPYARGPIRSLPLEEAACEAKRLAGAGYRAGAHRHRNLLLGTRSQKWAGPDRPCGGGVRRRAGVPGAAGLPGTPHRHGGLLPPGRRPAQPVPPLPPLHAERLRRHVEADEPEI